MFQSSKSVSFSRSFDGGEKCSGSVLDLKINLEINEINEIKIITMCIISLTLFLYHMSFAPFLLNSFI